MHEPETLEAFYWRLERLEDIWDTTLIEMWEPIEDELHEDDFKIFKKEIKNLNKQFRIIRKDPSAFNNGHLSKLGHWIYKFGNLCLIAQKEIGVSTWIEKYELVNRGWTIRINDEINYYFGKPKN